MQRGPREPRDARRRDRWISTPAPLWIWLVGGAAALQITLGLAGIVLFGPAADPVPGRSIQILACGTIGAFLLLGAGSDERTASLGAILMMFSSSFAFAPSRFLEEVDHSLIQSLVYFKRNFREDAFVCPVLWLLIRDFPRTLSTASFRSRIRRTTNACFGISVFLVVANLVLAYHLLPSEHGSTAFLERFDAQDPNSAYWALIYGPVVLAILLVLARARSAPLEERTRVRWFTIGLAVGAGPTALYVFLASLFPELTPALRAAGWFDLVAGLLRLLILAIPLSTAYAVFVDRIVDVRIVLRVAAQYGLTKAVVALLVSAPFLGLAVHLYDFREDTLRSVFSGSSLAKMSLLAAIGTAALVFRYRLVKVVDRFFFRDQYDARQILSKLVETREESVDVDVFAHVLTTELERAFHAERIGLVILDETEHLLVPVRGVWQGLDTTTDLAYYLTVKGEPLTIDLELPETLPPQLDESERRWIADSDFRVLAPILSPNRRLVGIIGLGDKRSELPYGADDVAMIHVVAAAASVKLERLRRNGVRDLSRRAEKVIARECPRCGMVEGIHVTHCRSCETPLVSAAVPKLVAGKFEIQQKIGEGSAGIVYRATDTTLGRAVAVKAMPRSTPELAVAFRREARVMASVRHPNLALIYGAESWNGYPLLILEHLDLGTLAERLATGPLPISETVRLGVCITDALSIVHSAGLLHGDVKPSNIGFVGEDVPKLMDFGLVSFLPRSGSSANRHLHDENSGPHTSSPASPYPASGTPLYMSPEARAGSLTDPQVDLWALAVVLYESIAGTNPFERERGGIEGPFRIPDIREFRPDCSANLAGILGKELSWDSRKRSRSARALGQRLRGLVSEEEFVS